MFNEIETAEVYFPGGGRSFYRVGMALQIPTPIPNIYAKTDMVVESISIWRIFGLITIHLSNGEKVRYSGLPFSVSMSGFSDEMDSAITRKMSMEEERMKKTAPSSDTDTPDAPTKNAEAAGRVAPPVGSIEEEKI